MLKVTTVVSTVWIVCFVTMPAMTVEAMVYHIKASQSTIVVKSAGISAKIKEISSA